MVELKIKIILLTEMIGNDRNARNYYFYFFIFRFPARLLAETRNCIDANQKAFDLQKIFGRCAQRGLAYGILTKVGVFLCIYIYLPSG